jgi:Mlc titration factor MtfA (ptsG expression regulator)
MRLLFFLFVAGGIGAAFILRIRLRRKARLRLALQQPFLDEWVEILKRNLPPYAKLSADLRQELHQDMKIFLAEKSFEGCGGLAITDEIRVTIAAQACMLLLNREEDCYPKLSSVLVYPSTYVAGGKGLFTDKSKQKSVRLGESWGHGVVVLAWDSVKQGAFNFKDGRNVAMHEFAHQLDQEDGVADGAPILEGRSAYTSWAAVFSKEFNLLQEKKRKRKRSLLNKYGATHPAEFFAVATEAFFEKPKQLQKKHPELYEELQDYYKVNPIEWT